MLQQSCTVLLDKASGFNGVDRCNTCYQFVISFLYWQFFIFFSANHLQILGFFFGFVGLLISNQFVLLVYRSHRCQNSVPMGGLGGFCLDFGETNIPFCLNFKSTVFVCMELFSFRFTFYGNLINSFIFFSFDIENQIPIIDDLIEFKIIPDRYIFRSLFSN